MNKQRLQDVAKCPTAWELAETYGRTNQGTKDIEVYAAGIKEAAKRISARIENRIKGSRHLAKINEYAAGRIYELEQLLKYIEPLTKEN